MTDSPLSDLRFFRFPDLTTDVVRNIVLLVILLGLTVFFTILIQRKVASLSRKRSRRRTFDHFTSGHRMDRPLRELISRMVADAGKKDEFELINDSLAYESAVAELVETSDEEELIRLGNLRRTLHLNVMNPEVELVCTRQLLQDLPVRLLSTMEDGKLDLYCGLLAVSEDSLLIDLPYEEAIFTLLRQNPGVFLLFWREGEGETVFRINLDLDEEGAFPVISARHVFVDEELANRSSFRLSVDQPVTYRFMKRKDLFRRVEKPRTIESAWELEGRLVDLGYGGASLLTYQPLEEHGLAQVAVKLQGQTMRLMLEVLSQSPQGPGQFLTHGQFRGMDEDTRIRLNRILSREQIKRLRGKEQLHFKPGA